MKFSDITRSEALLHLQKTASDILSPYLKEIENIWQPADLLPDASLANFFEEVKLLQERAKNLSYDLLAVLVGDTITEEALPTYESWLYTVEGIRPQDGGNDNPWATWVRGWTAEENRHGDILNKYLYLTGRINMREMEASTQYLIADGFDIETGHDPYRNFIYTSFQELATQISHRRVATLAKKAGDTLLAKICGLVASDEGRHANAYSTFIQRVIDIDASEAVLAFEDMMRKKIVMPAHFLRESGMEVGKAFGHFTDAAQRLGVYTTHDYISILQQLLDEWKIGQLTDLTDTAEKAQEYLMRLPDRLMRVADRVKTPELEYQFKWIAV
ncbi:MAG: acyl-ACP desaturase [Spirosomaceae bacterium]|jgi:acyl-[acyl-carrier-protein] desaturase|nr:acyl-ACP desaturase [Spirosomataceae bacterium]